MGKSNREILGLDEVSRPAPVVGDEAPSPVYSSSGDVSDPAQDFQAQRAEFAKQEAQQLHDAGSDSRGQEGWAGLMRSLGRRS